MYFPFFKLHSWGKRSAVRRRRFIQRLLWERKCLKIDGIATSGCALLAMTCFFGSLRGAHLCAPNFLLHKFWL